MVGVLALAVLATSSLALAGKICFTRFDVPGATATMAFGINKQDVIVGAYTDANGLHGFRRDPDGTVTPIDVPGAVETEARGIEPTGAIVGRYTDVNLRTRGFLRRHTGKFTPIDFPGAVATVASGISARGEIVGYYTDADGLDHGFVLDDGVFTTLDAPGGLCGTRVFGIDRRRVAGSFNDCSREHGFRMSLTRPRFATIDVPGALHTTAYGTKRERIVGDYVDADGKTHAFLRRRGLFRTLEFPGAVETRARGIASGAPGRTKQIVGWAVDALGQTHGWHAALHSGC